MNKLVIFNLLALFIISCSPPPVPEEKFVRPVKYEEIGFANNQKLRSFSGTATSDKVINLSFRNAGIITQYNIALGKQVRRGQLLARLDNVQPRLAYEQALTQQNSAESQMNTSKLNLNRVRSLFEKGSASLSDFESAKNAYKTAKESYESAKRGVQIQKEQMSYGYLYAPENGVISDVIAEIDENVSPGQTIATMNAGQNMEITIGLPESIINAIVPEMDVTVLFSSLTDNTYMGKVTEIAPAVDPNTATYPVKVILSNAGEDIKSGMACNVTFDFGDKQFDSQTLVVPAKAVGEDSEGRFVYIIYEEDSKVYVKKTHITIGSLNNEGFEVLSGLSQGQKVATAGLQTLLDGQEVRLF